MRLAVLTSGRQDWGILRSTCLLVRDDPRFELLLLVGGMHCSEDFGRTERLIQADGFSVTERLPWIDDPASASSQAAQALRLVGEALQRQRPDAVLLVGDRFDTAAAALAATISRVPVIHLHGGEETLGAFDDQLRHAISKLSHLHLVSHPNHARRLEAMGEDPASIHVVGAPGIDNIHRPDLADRSELERELGLRLEPPTVLVTIQPPTLSPARLPRQPVPEVAAVVGVMDEVPATYVITLPNSDPGHEEIRDALQHAAAGRGRRVAVEAMGDRRYWGLMRVADALLGNSSSGLIEAPALQLPAINLGERQAGRQHGANVIDVPIPTIAATADALQSALAPAFRAGLNGKPLPFGDGHSAPRIVDILAAWTPPRPPRKPPIRMRRAA